MKNLQINDLDRHFRPLHEELSAATQRVLGSGWYILGPEVKEFEKELYLNSGTDNDDEREDGNASIYDIIA